MRKKILVFILSLVMCGACLTGCSLFEHNDEKDARQVIATVDTIKDYDGDKLIYESGKRYIYKSDLISAMNSYAQQYMQNYSLTLQQATERLLDELITRELLLIEADRLLARGDLEWTQKDTNDQNKNVYGSLDSLFASLRNQVLSDYDEDTNDSGTSNEESGSTTYPTLDAETTDDDYTYVQFDEHGNIIYEDKKDKDGNIVYEEVENANGELVRQPVQVPKYIVWEPTPDDYPAMHGTEEEKSLERETMRRLVNRLEELVDADFKATKSDRAEFAKDKQAIDDVMNTKGIEAVYPMLGNTHMVQYLVGVSARQSIMLTKLQEYITKDVAVSDEEVTESYRNTLASQYATYTADVSAYQTAVKEGNTTVLYYPDDSYFFVKHILLPFSDKQVADMNAYKADPANAGKDYTAMRDTQMVNETVVYPHVDGENDTSNPKTVQQVFDEIQSAMASKASNPKEAERTFDELIYKYSTDTGSISLGHAYAVKRGDDEGHSGYMEEFYDGAMKLYREYNEGDMLPEIVVTDYGVHVMYFSKKIIPGTQLALDDPLTPAAYKTVRETFHDQIQTNKQNNAFQEWQDERITYYKESAGVTHKYTKRYKSLYED